MKQCRQGVQWLILLSWFAVWSAQAQDTTCPGSLPSRLIVGATATVLPDTPNNIRAEPTTGAPRIGQIPVGGVMQVLDGPVCANGYAWYQVDYDGLIGWTVESVDGEYALDTVSSVLTGTLDETGRYALGVFAITIEPQFRATLHDLDPDHIYVTTHSDDRQQYNGVAEIGIRLNEDTIAPVYPSIIFYNSRQLEAVYEQVTGSRFPTIDWLRDVLETRPESLPGLPDDPQIYPEFLLAFSDGTYLEFENGAGVRVTAVYNLEDWSTYNYLFYGIQTCPTRSPVYVTARIPLLNVSEQISDLEIDAWYRLSNPIDDPEIADAVAAYDAMIESIVIDTCPSSS